jgi:arsenical pump membrane protein
LVIFGGHMPHLAAWLAQFGLPSVISIGVTYLALRMTQRRALAQEKIAHELPRPRLTHGGRLTIFGIGAIALVLLCCSALNVQLGLPTFICGAVTSAFVLAFNRQSPLPIIKGVSWGVLPLVAGLFVLVEALDHTGVIAALNGTFYAAVANSITVAAWSAGLVVALASNLMNNLVRWADCWLCCKPNAFAGGWRNAYRSGFGAEPLSNRLACDYSLACSAAKGGT